MKTRIQTLVHRDPVGAGEMTHRKRGVVVVLFIANEFIN